MEGIIATAVLVALLAAGVFFAARKLYRDKKSRPHLLRRQRLLLLLRLRKKTEINRQKRTGKPSSLSFFYPLGTPFSNTGNEKVGWELFSKSSPFAGMA